MKIITCLTFLCFIKCLVGQKYLNYVCHSFSSYNITRHKNSNCYRSIDVLGSFEEIVQFYGYNTEVFEVITEDQYILKLFRITPKIKSSTSVRAPVLLVHGTTSSSTLYTLVENRSLAYLLANEGYDVWVSNLRGTSYSSGHKYLKPNDKRYWDFSFHEQGIYDVKAVLDLVTSKVNQKVIYISYSSGAMVYYAYNIMNPDEAIQKVRISISLAPTIYLHLMRTPLLDLVELIPYWESKGALDILFPEGVLYHRTPAFVKFLLHFCFDLSSQVLLCDLIKNLVIGFNVQQEAPETFPVLAAQSTETTSLKMFYHLFQLVKSKKFQQFDYGEVKNLMRYGTPHPPLYNLSLINVPSHIIYGTGDIIASEENVKLFYQRLPEVAKPFGEPYRVKDEKFCHIDMVVAKDIKTLVNDHIIEFLKENEVYINN